MNKMINGKYDLIINGYDWGPGVDKLIIHSDKTFSQNEIDIKDFAVTTEIIKPDWSVMPIKYGKSTGIRTVISAYLCDVQGNKVETESDSIALELSVHPDDPYSNPFLYGSNMMNDWQETYNIIVKNDNLKLLVKKPGKRICPLADQFEMGQCKTKDITLRYASWKPANENHKKPLVIWLHGMGEGGTDPYIALLGNKVVSLITDKVQKCFGETGASVLVPQTEGFWMQIEENQDKLTRWINSESKTTVSIYTNALFNLIKNYLGENPDIDTNRIYIGGCSNGGYMTMNMIIEYPDFFAAAYPVCQAYPDVLITEDKLNILANQPIWFIQSKDDKTVDPLNYTVPTYNRLREMKAKDIHFSFYEHVEDQTGKYFDSNKKPYIYNGHFSWIYGLNNDCIDSGETLFQWLAQKCK